MYRFGDAKGSGYGPKEQGAAAREFFTHATSVHLQGGQPSWLPGVDWTVSSSSTFSRVLARSSFPTATAIAQRE
jgi:hypothetical protein